MSADAIDADFKPLVVRENAALAAPQLLDALRPADRVALMAEISNVVKDVIEKQKWYADIRGKKHILIQGWTFIGGLGGCSVKTTHTEQIDGGFKAHAVVVRCDTGIEVGSAEQVCMKNESFGRGKDDYALIGMASTRACSRALSTVFRHVVELAGYSATPLEEMGSEDVRPTAASGSSPGEASRDAQTPPSPRYEPALITDAQTREIIKLGAGLAPDYKQALLQTYVGGKLTNKVTHAQAEALLEALRGEPKGDALPL